MEATEDPLTSFEKALSFMGMNTPFNRFVAVFSLSTAVMLTLKPGFAFTDQGDPKQWSLLHSSGDGTLVPWFLPGTVLGGIFAFFI